MSVPTHKEITDAAYAGNLDLLRELAQRDANLNEVNPDGDTLLEEVLFHLCADEEPYRYAVARTLIELRADPKILGEENSSPLTSAMLSMDTEMLRILLEAGADPNKASGFDGGGSFFDWAEFDYRYNIYDLHLPDNPTEDDKKDEDSWLRFLDRLAIKNNVRRPNHLFLLRRYGAKRMSEIKQNA